MRITETPFTVFDLETTGLDVAKDRIVEVGVARFRPGEAPTREAWLVNPGMPIPKEASDVHGITDEHVAPWPPFGTLASKLRHELDSTALLVGYNARRYDAPLLSNELARVGQDWKVIPTTVLDVLDVVNWHHRGARERKQTAIGALYGVKPTGGIAHSAAVDAQMTGELLLALVARGVLPDDLDEARVLIERWAKQHDEEFARWSYWLFHDRNDGTLRIGAGKHCGTALAMMDRSYLRWMKEQSFIPASVVEEIRKVMIEGNIPMRADP